MSYSNNDKESIDCTDNEQNFSDLNIALDYYEEEDEEREEMKKEVALMKREKQEIVELEKIRGKKKKRISSTHEDGEVLSDEDGMATPPFTPRKCHSHDETPPTLIKESPQANICRHFLQGRCSYGDECRFLHKLQDSTNESSGRSPKGSHGSSHRFVPTLGHAPNLCDTPPLDLLHPPSRYSYYNHMTWPVHPGGGARGGVAPPISRDKEEESEGWHRLRTITQWEGGDSDDEEYHRSAGSNRDLRTKLEKRKYIKPTSDSDESEVHTTKKKKLKRKSPPKERRQREEEERKEGEEREDDWIDPWSRSKVTKKKKKKKQKGE